MATLVLTTVGSFLGGPIGAAIGGFIGSRIDNSLLAPTRSGPRLSDLSVQTSTYGSALPKLFGTLRVAGTVIWATDLQEDVHHSGSAKNGTKTTSYSYSANFAVALSARAIAGVGRIWADGNLLRGSAGDWKSETGFRLYPGDEDQPIDPLIASAEGAASTPAHRGIAYAVFEGMQLANYGNRIPSLTFEVIADDTAVPIVAIAEVLSEGAMTGAGGDTLGGYAASGESIRATLETLATAFPMALCDDGAVLRIDTADATPLDPADLGTGSDRAAARVSDRRSAAGLPDAVSVSYYDPARDYQAGLQRARRDGIGLRALSIEVPASLDAGEAKARAEAALARAWAVRTQRTATVPWRYLDTRAGALATLEGEPLRIGGWALEKMALKLTMAPEVAAGSAVAVAGRIAGDGDAPAGATALALLDLPVLGDTLPSRPSIWLAAAGTGAGWRRAECSLSLDGGASWAAAGRTALPAILGSAATVLGAGSARLIDRSNAVEIEMLHAGMALASADMAALIGGANMAMLGAELLQFGTATQLSATRWRLSTLLRGRRGSEAAIGGHATDERFVLLDAARLLALDVPLAALGTAIRVSAVGPGDDGVAVEQSLAIVGRAVRPPSPVAFAGSAASGDVDFGWTRRSRAGWTWLDGADAPLGEDAERYRLTITPSTGSARIVEVDAPAYTYTAADRAADGAAGATALTIELCQLGTAATSEPATATILL